MSAGTGIDWAQALLALLVAHAVGDVLFQTDWQARMKARGLGDPLGRRALAHHMTSYTVALIPALVWIGAETSIARALLVGVLVVVTHLIIDDTRLVRVWLRTVKHSHDPTLALSIAVDQTMHALCLLGAALIAAM